MKLPKFKLVTDEMVETFCKTWNREADDPKDRGAVDADYINRGWCYQFAWFMRIIYGRKVKLYSSSGHAFVKIGRRFFDSDHRWGTFDFTDLSPYAKPVTIKAFFEMWSTGGGTGPIQHKVLKKAAAKYRNNNSL